MSGTVVLARQFGIEIGDVDGTDTPIMVEVDGLTDISPSASSEDADGNHFGLAGYAGHSKSQRGLAYTFEGLMLIDRDTGARDPGQARLKALGNLIGDEAEDEFRITAPNGETREGRVTVTYEEGGGGLNDNADWSATVTFNGAWEDGEPA